MNSRVKFIAAFRTLYFVPSVVSGVALAVLWLQVFNNDYGLLNKLLQPLASALHTRAPDWFGQDAARWAIVGSLMLYISFINMFMSILRIMGNRR